MRKAKQLSSGRKRMEELGRVRLELWFKPDVFKRLAEIAILRGQTVTRLIHDFAWELTRKAPLKRPGKL